MRRDSMRLCFTFLAALVIPNVFAGAAQAQQFIFGVAGPGHYSTNIGGFPLQIAGGAQFRPVARLGLEPEGGVLIHLNRRGESDNSLMVAFTATPQLVTKGHFRPFIAIGVSGWIGPPGLVIGGGLDVRSDHALGFRIEFRDYPGVNNERAGVWVVRAGILFLTKRG